MGMRVHPGIEHFIASVTLPALVATPVGCPAMKGLVWARPMWGRIYSRCGPTIFLELPVSDPNNEPKLPRYEAVIYLLALIAFVALMVWAAIQWM
jgi:hypothetical protein